MAMKDSTISFISYEQREVETFGKGKPFSRMDKVESEVSFETFIAKFRYFKFFVIL